MNHDEIVRKIVSALDAKTGTLKSRESNTVEFKESFNAGSTVKYAKTMAAFANNRGGYIIFGVKDKPREVVGLKNDNFENLKQEEYTESINSLFSPSMNWDCGTINIDINANNSISTKYVGWIYTESTEQKPIVAQKNASGEKIVNGDVFYRYRARSEKIKFAEMNRIIEERVTTERERLLKILDVIRKSGTANLGIVNYSNGKFSTPYGVDFTLDRKLVTQVLRKAKYIKEGSFNETDGTPVIKVTGNIDLAEEVPVPDIDPDIGYPHLQKGLAEILNISLQDLYALIFHYKMKEQKIYHIEVKTSRSGSVHKFSNYTFQFLKEKFEILKNNEAEFETIRAEYRNRNKSQGHAQ